MPSPLFMPEMSQFILASSMSLMVRNSANRDSGLPVDDEIDLTDAEEFRFNDKSFVDGLIEDAFASGFSVTETLALCEMATRSFSGSGRHLRRQDVLAEYERMTPAHRALR